MFVDIKKNKKTLIFSTIFVLAAFFVGFSINPYSFCSNQKFRYTNPDLMCGKKLVISKQGYSLLKNKLEVFIQEQKNEQNISSVSVYFRDLQNGPTLGLEEHERFSPASLLKLPMALTYIDIMDKIPEMSETKVAFSKFEGKDDQYYPPKESLEENKPYTIGYMVDTMIKYSDNRSYYALREYLHQMSPEVDLLERTFFDLGIVDPKSFSDQTLSVKSYASIFVQLYHDSFFSKNELSNKALELLAQTDFSGGLVAGVPSGIKVAHKFGERSNLPNNGKQLHDCGIIYYPENPYLLCIMTRGYDFEALSEVVTSISKMFYEEFDSRKL